MVTKVAGKEYLWTWQIAERLGISEMDVVEVLVGSMLEPLDGRYRLKDFRAEAKRQSLARVRKLVQKGS